MAKSASPRLELVRLSKRFPGTLANDQISLNVHSGEIHALLGENGAGKSTLMNLIYGVLTPDSGQIIWEGREVDIRSPQRAKELGIGMVFQHFSLFETLTVRENLLLALPKPLYGRYRNGLLDQRIEALGQTLKLDIALDRNVESLSAGEKQRVEIARCLLLDVRLLILDEPTSVLTPKETTALISILRNLADTGCSLLFISHKIDEVRELCDRATVLRAGKVTGDCSPAETSREQMTKMILGEDRLLESQFSQGQAMHPALSLKNLGAESAGRRKSIQNLNLTLDAGTIVGLAGVSGNGQETLVDLISGEIFPDRGEIQFEQESIQNADVCSRRSKGISTLPVDRLGRGAIGSFSLVENFLLTGYCQTGEKALIQRMLINWSATQAGAEQVIRSFQVKTHSSADTAKSLSGGNLQKFLVGREISADPKVLVLYNPTWGVDLGAANLIHRALIELRDQGAAILVISEDLDELFLISDKMGAICEGQLSPVLNKSEVDLSLLGLWMTDPNGFNFPESALLNEHLLIPAIHPDFRTNMAIFFPLAALAAFWFVTQKTLLGFQIKVLGESSRAARYAGFTDKKLIWIALSISGALAGLAGVSEVTGQPSVALAFTVEAAGKCSLMDILQLIDLIENLLFATFRSGTPILLCALGVLVAEKSGVLNLGQEGMMLMGAVIGFIVSFHSGSHFLGLICGTLAGMTSSLLFAFLTLQLHANQVATGLALTITGTGLSAFIGAGYLGEALVAIPPVSLPLLTEIPVVGRALFGQDPLVYLSLCLSALIWWFCFSSRWGLLIRAIGENPESANKLGISVLGLRYLCTLIGGSLAGLGGTYLSLSYTPIWAEGMSAGRGWIALALVVFASWRVGRLLLGAYLFGMMGILNLIMQGFGWSISANLLATLPYVMTILVLIILATSSGSATSSLSKPRALGQTYFAEKYKRDIKKARTELLAVSLFGLLMLATPVAAEPLKVAFMHENPVGEGGWTLSHELAREALEEYFGDAITTTALDSVPPGADAERALTRLARDGNQLVFATSFGFMNATQKVSRRFQNTYFEHASGHLTAENVGTYQVRAYQGRYLSGIAAGRVTESNQIGYVAPFAIPEVIRGINAFTLGVKSVNPDAVVDVVWISTWSDAPRAREATDLLIAKGADVITHHTETSAAIQAADLAGAWSIGYQSDRSGVAPNKHLVSVVHNWLPIYIGKVQSVIDGNWTSSVDWVGIEEDATQLISWGNAVPDSIITEVKEAHTRILNGELQPFTGPLTDRDGNPRLNAGETLDDESMILHSIANAEIDLTEEVQIRQDLIQTALAREEADLIIKGPTVLNVFTQEWQENQDIVIRGKRIAWVGDSGTWPGKAKATIDASDEWAVPGFGESHKHIESSYLTPEYEAALVIPRGNTWTMEGSHELSNAVGDYNVAFWLLAEDAGSPLKIFPAVGSATPPTAYETSAGYYGHAEMDAFMKSDLRVAALGEVMDWTAVSNPDAPANERIWGMIRATWENRGVVEGHASGLRSIDEINAFAAAGLSSDHEVRLAQEGLDKVRRGIFLEVRPDAARTLFPMLLEVGITDWSNISVTTDDRDVAATIELGAMDYNIRNAIDQGVPAEVAYQMGSYNTARHFHVEHLVGSIAPGRFADVVLLDDPETVSITRVIANGQLASTGTEYQLPIVDVEYPDWANKTMNVGRAVEAADFTILAPQGQTEVTAAIMQPFYFEPDFMTETLPVAEGVVYPDAERGITKVAVVDRYSGEAAVSKMFWKNVGPVSAGSALASSQMHDIHNIWVVGNEDAAMATAANAVADMQGGWALVQDGELVATVSLELAGLMTARPVEEVQKEVEALFDAADEMEWIGAPGLPERMRFAFLTASPWKWQLVAPYEGNPGGFVNVTTGETHPIIW
eukprot:g4418.t1